MAGNKQKVYFVVTIDTEEEWDWNGNFPQNNFSVKNTRRIPKFQTFCNQLGIKPTYLVDYSIVSDPEAVTYLRKPFERGECEVGAHLHPWCNPPVEETVCAENSHIVNLPIELVGKKLKNLTEKITDQFGRRPVSFRAGRWGINGKLLKLLSNEGYEIDTSVLPFFSDTAFSYQSARETPYWPDFNDCLAEGPQRRIFEIPASTGFNRKDFQIAGRLYRVLLARPLRPFHLVGVFWHLRWLRKLQISPELCRAPEMQACADTYLRKGNRVVNMFFHSSSLLPGCTYYVANEADENAFYKRIADFVEYLHSKADVRFVTLTEAKKEYLKEGL